MPPREASDQVNWSEKQPNVYELDNQSLVAEFLMLDDCFCRRLHQNLTPAHGDTMRSSRANFGLAWAH